MVTNEIIYAFSVSLLFILILNFWVSFRFISLNAKIADMFEVMQEIRNKVFEGQRQQDFAKDEKRFKYRARSHLTGLIMHDGQTYPVDIHDISKTGALIQSIQLNLTLGQDYKIKFSIDGKGDYELMMKPVRVKPGDPHHYGAIFKNATLGTLREISDYVASLASEELRQDFDPKNV